MRPQTIQEFTANDTTLVFTFTANGSIAGDTYEFVCVDKNGALKFRKTSGSGITTTDAGSSSTPGVVSVSLVDALEIPALSAPPYPWRLRRTNVGRESVVAFGTLPLDNSFKGAV